MQITTEAKKIYVLAALAIFAIIGAVILVVKGDELNNSRDPKARVALLMQDGVDTSHSLFLPEETTSILGKIEDRKSKFLSGTDSTAQNLMDLAREVKNLRDFDLALQLFDVVDTFSTPDLFYKIDVGRIYLERGEWENARLVFEPLRLTWPVRETYIELATAYQHIEGTPEYVIDQIYEEGIHKTFGDFELLDAYVQWLEKTGREEQTIPYLEQMNAKVPQSILEQKIKDLKAKYQK